MHQLDSVWPLRFGWRGHRLSGQTDVNGQGPALDRDTVVEEVDIRTFRNMVFIVMMGALLFIGRTARADEGPNCFDNLVRDARG